MDDARNNKFSSIIDEKLGSIGGAVIEEGMILSINSVVSNAISIPAGEYIVANVTASRCVLVPTSEAGKDKFEVLKPTLLGFFNPEIHKKTVDKANGNTIAESGRRNPGGADHR